MRALIQRVRRARVDTGGKTLAAVGQGYVVLAGFEHEDGEADIEWTVGKLVRLRLFLDESGAMNRSITEVGGEILVVSQFTLHASTKKGTRPSWHRAAPAALSEPMFRLFARRLEGELGRPVAVGIFGADMQIELINDGPVTIMLDSKRPE